MPGRPVRTVPTDCRPLPIRDTRCTAPPRTARTVPTPIHARGTLCPRHTYRSLIHPPSARASPTSSRALPVTQGSGTRSTLSCTPGIAPSEPTPKANSPLERCPSAATTCQDTTDTPGFSDGRVASRFRASAPG